MEIRSKFRMFLHPLENFLDYHLHMGNFPGNFLARYGIVAFLNLGDIIISGLYHFLHFIGKASGLSFHLYCLFFFLLL